jgi:hypothetical protein
MNITKEQHLEAREIFDRIWKLEAEITKAEELKESKFKVMAIMEPGLVTNDILDIYIANAKAAITQKKLELEAL